MANRLSKLAKGKVTYFGPLTPLPKSYHWQRSLSESEVNYIEAASIRGCPRQTGEAIVRSCREFGILCSMGFALCQHESDFRPVYGHDPVRNPASKGGQVTQYNYTKIYLPARKKGLGMQGVRETQLTWWETQDLADAWGGCWRLIPNIRVGIMTLAARIKEYGLYKGIARYNGIGLGAERYANIFIKEASQWRNYLLDHDRAH